MIKHKGIATLLATLLAVSSVFVACKPTNPASSSSDSSSQEEVGVYEPVELENNGVNIAEYSIVISQDAGAATQYAAEMLNTYIQKATKSALTVVKDDVAESEHEIVLGKTNRGIASTYDYTELGQEGYSLKNVEEKLYILGNDSRGLIYGVYAYLNALGYRFYTATVENIPKAAEVFVPETIDVTYVPPFVYREIIMDEGILDVDFAVRSGINSGFMRSALKSNKKYGGYAGFAGGDKLLVHTMSTFLPDSEYSAHPEYFAYYNGARTTQQPCLTSEGALGVVYSNVQAVLNSDTGANMISVSMNDNAVICNCENCELSYQTYGYSGTLLNFVNKIAEWVERDYLDRELYVETLSYGISSRDTPKNGVVPRDNVIIRFCTSICNLHNDCEDREAALERLETWSSITKNIYVWNYIVSYANHEAPVPNFEMMYKNTKTFYENNAIAIYYEGFGTVTLSGNGEFPELRTYVLSKLAFNPSMSYAEYRYHMEDFCYGYYGEESGEKILEYIDYIQQVALDYTAKNGTDFDVNGDADKYLPLDFDFNEHTYDLSWIEHCQALFDEAEASASAEQLVRIQKSRIHLTFMELFNTFKNRYKYGTEEEREELVERNRQLYISMKKFGVWMVTREQLINQNKDINDLDEFKSSPATW